MDDVRDEVEFDSEDEVLLVQEVHDEHVLPVWNPTGQAIVDEALELLQALDDDVHAQAPVYDDVHRRLRDCLASQES